jgi:hypothetical protein
MADSQGRGLPGSARTPVVFVTDASAEAARIADVLRTSGYAVHDVPLAMLVPRLAVQKPQVVLLDVDAAGALDEVVKLRRLPGAGGIDFVYFGAGGGPVKSADEALAHEGSAFFGRPVDVSALAKKVEALTGGPASRSPSSPPSAAPSDRPSTLSLPAPGLRSTPGPPLPMSSPSLVDLLDPPRSLATFGTVSSELQSLLAEAERRAESSASAEAPLPSPEEEIEAVLPADVLASLDEPLDGDEDEEGQDPGPQRTGAGIDRGDRGEGTGAHAKGTTSGGSKQPTTASGRATTHERKLGSDAPPRSVQGAAVPSGAGATSQGPHDTQSLGPSPTQTWGPAESRRTDAGPRGSQDTPPMRRTQEFPAVRSPTVPPPVRNMTPEPRPATVPPPSRGGGGSTLPMIDVSDLRDLRGPSVQPGVAPPSPGTVLVDGADARRALADAIGRRATGALCYEQGGVVRRVVLRDGDFVTAASGAERETLVHFLGARGELPRDEVERIASKVPPYGRHAGAALVAHGWLSQDQLWGALRAHAEWIAAGVLGMTTGTALLEPEPPGRLRNEPSVFGASTGAEIFVELVRRTVTPDEAIAAMGGEGSRVADGPHQGLLAECALAPPELELLSRARGGTLRDLLARAPDAEIVSVVHALALLGVVEVVPAPDFQRGRADASADPAVVALDDEAVRARVRARMELVDEGDYFSVLGVARDATSYEVRRAFVELRRAFEPSRILTPRLADLADDVKKITIVLEEAYEILRDNARRERYRRAIDARPET